MFRFLITLLVGLGLSGCAGHRAVPDESLPVAIVPGCPAEVDGRLSFCLWRRAIWAHQLYQAGRVSHFITSGSAVYNRYVEADALRAGMIALGVPASAISTETQALHTDENMGYSLLIAQALGFERLAVASDRNQALGGCMMIRRWGHDCVVLGLNRDEVHARRVQPLPDVTLSAVPASEWQTLEEREQARAEAEGRRRRPASIPYYVAKGVVGLFGFSKPPEPPASELGL